MKPPPDSLRLSSAAEAQVAALAAAGSDAAFAELVRRRQGSLRALMRRLSGDPVLADDLAQQAFLQAWRTLRQLKSPGAFGGWLRQVAINVWLQHARLVRPPTDPLDGLEAEPETAAPDTAARLDLSAALTQLRPAQRLCIVLNYGEGLSHAEIAASTGWPLGAVKSHIARGTARLRRLLGVEVLS